MIKLAPRPPEPEHLNSAVVQNTLEEIRSKINNGENVTARLFPAHWLHPSVREPLWEIHKGKCAYCERARDIKRESDVDHFRPKGNVTENNNRPGYWWLAYEWTNYLYACKTCNQGHKKNHFPLIREERRAFSPEDNIECEQPVLINPIDEDPEEYIVYSWEKSKGLLIKALGIDDERRGERTIEILGLNRLTLMKERADLINDLEVIAMAMVAGMHYGNLELIERIRPRIESATKSERFFAGLRRYYFSFFGLGEFISND